MIDYRQRVLNYLQHIATSKPHKSITFASWEAPTRSSTTNQLFWERGLLDLNEIILWNMHYDILFRCAILSNLTFNLGHKHSYLSI